MTTRVFLRPDAATISANNGIGRVVHAQYRYLPQYDIELVSDVSRADVVAGHTHDHGAGRIEACHLHGLYWLGDSGSGEYDNWHREANTRIIASMRRARALTVPSNWVGECIRRDMRISPTVIGHGIDFAEWTPGDNDGYVLWGKNRNGDVCNPIWAYELAKRKVKVWTTFAPKAVERPFQLTVIGELQADKMRETIRRADVYLATTKETFGIQTLEALASGVPVLGFDWGGTADIVRHRETGYLARPGDIDDLMRGLDFIRLNRQEMGRAARESARGYTWERVIGQYAELYHALARASEPTGVAVVVTCHNYQQYIGACLDSLLAQTYRPDEIIVVDDGSTDASRHIVEGYAVRGVRLIAQPNSGVASARNNGIAATQQPFVICLDADDMLDPRYVEACRNALLRDRGLGIVWTGMSILRAGQSPTANVWTGSFDWEWQATPGVPPRTTIPTGAMFRRSMWERAGGYKQQHAPGEDAEFYTRGLSVGFTAAQITDMPWYIYRDHGGGAHKRLPYKPIDEWLPWMRDREYPLAAPSLEAPNVRSYSEPRVSVIIPVGPGHGKYLPDALESLLGQSMREWEAIVVDNSTTKTGPITQTSDIAAETFSRFPFAKFLPLWSKQGPGPARNLGIEFANAPLVLFLDADDQLAPGALAALCKAYAAAEGRYVYGDWQAMGQPAIHAESEYNPAAWLDFDSLTGKHAVTVLMATADAKRIQFDTELPGWEDWDFFARAALEGIYGKRVPAVTLYVRVSDDGRTGRVMREPGPVLSQLRDKLGGKTMAKTCCGGNADSILAARRAWEGTPMEKAGGLTIRQTTRTQEAPMAVYDPNVLQPVRMEFTGKRSGAVTYNGVRGSGRQYRGGNNPIDKYHNVHPDDVSTLEGNSDWRRVAPSLTDLTGGSRMPPIQAPATPIVAREALPAELPVTVELDNGASLTATGEGTLESVTGPDGTEIKLAEGIPVPIAEVETVQVVENGEGVVKRKRVPRKPKNSSLLDLPPLG